MFSLDRDLAGFDDNLAEMGASVEVRADLVDRARIFALTADDDPRAGPDIVAFLLDVGEISEVL